MINSAGNDDTAFLDKQWDKPLIIRHNGNDMEYQAFLNVSKANQEIINDPKYVKRNTTDTDTDANITDTDTEIEITLPITNETSDLDVFAISKYCSQYMAFTTDISLEVNLVEEKAKEEEGRGGPAAQGRKSKIIKDRLMFKALHPIADKSKWNNMSSVWYYKPEDFARRLLSIHGKDRENTSIYDRLRTLREGNLIKKKAAYKISIAELMRDPKKDKKIEELYQLLRQKMKPPTRLSSPYSSIKTRERKWHLISRITRYGTEEYQFSNFDVERAVYKVVYDTHTEYSRKDSSNILLQYPFMIEIIAIPVKREIFKSYSNYNRPSEFIGSINYSVPPKENLFEGDYGWSDRKEKDYPRYADNMREVLETFGFNFEEYSSEETKIPCVIAVNLVSPRLDYHSHDKSRINTKPFEKALILAAQRISDETRTFKGVGIRFSKPRQVSEDRDPSSYLVTLRSNLKESGNSLLCYWRRGLKPARTSSE